MQQSLKLNPGLVAQENQRFGRSPALRKKVALATQRAVYQHEQEEFIARLASQELSRRSREEYDPDFIARINGLEDTAQFVRVHSGTEYWTAAIGFWPGANFLMALDPRCKLVTPKYNPPRTFTPEGALGMGGASTCIYPVATPGGYQIFGRTPVPTWDTTGRFPEFEGNICLFRPTDRVKFTPVGLTEFEDIANQVATGCYRYNVVEYQRFSVKNYRDWTEKLDTERRF